MNMKAITLRGPENVTIDEVPVPETGPGDILLKVQAALTCGTDLKVFTRGGHPRMIKVPSIFGHEMAGTVETVGSDVEGFSAGDRVVPANSAPCGECWCCRENMPNQCEDMLYINGAFAQYALLPERLVKKNLHRIPDGMSFREAAMTEPMACAIHGADAAAVSQGDTVCVCGAGPLGLMLMASLSDSGVRVIASDPVAQRREAALAAGADEAIDPTSADTLAETILPMTEGGRGLHAAIDATGLPAVWEQCPGAVRKGGSVVFFGGAKPGTTVTLDTGKVHYDELTIKGLYHHTPDYVRKAVGFLSNHPELAEIIITTSMPLEETEAALRMMGERKALKVEILPHTTEKFNG